MKQTIKRIILSILPFICGCSSNKEKIDICPNIFADFDMAKASYFKGDNTNIKNEKYRVEIGEIMLDCKQIDESDNKTLLRLEPEFKVIKGMAFDDNTEFSYFVALIDKDKKIVSKQIHNVKVHSFSNLGYVLIKDDDDVKIEIDGNPYDYSVYVGLQIDNKQLEYNRSKKLWLN